MKTFLIAGASGGIGNEIARTLNKKGNRLILLCNNNEKELKEFKGQVNIQIIRCDLTSTSELEKLLNQLKKYESIDGFVFCSGVSRSGLIQDVTEEDYSYIMDTNFKACVMLTKLVAKNMIFNKSGKIVFISSMWGVVGASMESLYSASKGAMNTFTLSLAKELGPSGITVNAICPGLIDTKMNACYSKEDIKDLVEATPISRIGKPKDVAYLTEFLLSNKADFITGQIITVDGGFSL